MAKFHLDFCKSACYYRVDCLIVVVVGKEFIRKSVTVIASFAILLQSFTPLVALAPQVAYAQEVSPTDTPAPTDTVSPTTTPTDTTSPTPTDTVTPTDTASPTPDTSITTTPSDTPTLTDTPTSSPTDTVSPTTDQSSPTTSQDNQNNPSNGPPSVNPTDASTPTVTPTESSNVSGHVDTTVLSHVAAPSLDLSSSNDQSATLSTDKADYAPTDTAVITGANFVANKTYTLEIVSTDAPAVDFTTVVTTDNSGDFIYAYQLDGNYRPNYTIYVKDGPTTVATTTFTDSNTPNTTPNGVGSSNNWSGSPTNTDAGKVSATQANDSDTSYIFTSSLSNTDQLFTVSSAGVPVGATINSVTVHAFAKYILSGSTGSTPSDPALILLTKSGATLNTGASAALTTSYTEYTQTLTTNPNTGLAWTGSEVDAVQIGVRSAATQGTQTRIKTPRVTQLYLVVDYTPAVTPTPTPTSTATPTPTPAGSFGSVTDSNVACMADQPGQAGLVCTANDTSLSNATIISINDDGCKFPGDTVNFTASWQIATNATQRYNMGLWFATAGQSSAMHGTCSVSTLPSSPSPFFSSKNGDTCGDMNSSGPGTVTLTMTATCNPDVNGLLKLPYCTSWQQNDNSTCTDPQQTVPGTGSKCSCQDGSTIPVTIPPAIEVIKNIVPSNDPGLFNLQVNGTTKKVNATNGDTTGKVGVTAGSNSFGEAAGTNTTLSNYTATASCVLRGTQTAVTANQSGNTWTLSNVTNGQDIVCTITNTANTGSLKIVKNTVGGDGTFDFSVTGPTASTPEIVTSNDTGSVTQTVNIGSYSVTETPVAGWTTTYSNCTNVTVSANQTTTCTVTNTKQATLTVNKICDPSNDGGKFNLQIDGTTAGTGANASCGGTTGAVVASASAHTVGETAGTNTTLSHYTQTFGGDCDANGNVSLTAGQNKVCTITNTLKRGTIIVKKTMVGGTDSFTFTGGVAGTIATSGGTLTTSSVLPGTYTSVEAATAGWDLTNLSCDDTDSTGNLNTATATFNVSPGETVTCTFTNTKKGHLIVHKAVNTVQDQNDTLFAINASGSGSVSGSADRQVSVNAPVDYEVTPGTYSVSETVPTGWDLTTNGCLNKTVAAGQTVDCTITNTQRGSIDVLKYEDLNADGRKDANEPGLQGWGINLSGYTQQTTDAQGTTSYADVVPGNYTLSENLQSGWHQSNIICTGQDGWDTDNSHDFTLNPGQHVSCQVANYRDAHVIVTKDVVDPDGNPITDTSTLFGFTLGSDSANLTDNDSHDFTVTPGVFAVTETPNANYDFGACTSSDDQSGLSVTNGYSSTLQSGQTIHVTCTNKQKKATITVVKNVVASDGQTDVSDNHTFSVTLNGITKDFGEGNSATFDVNPGSYSASEAAETNYTLVSNDGPKTVSSNGTATITIINKQNPGQILGTKTDATSKEGIANWVINLYTCQANFLNCVLSTSTQTDSNGNYSFDNLVTGYYQVAEFLDSAWTAVGNLFYNVTITPGHIDGGNDFVNFKNMNITVCKKEDADGSLGTTNDQTNVFGWTVKLITDGNVDKADVQTTGRDGCYTFTNVGPNHTYTVAEEVTAGWTALSDTSFPVTVASGDDQTFTFINFHNVSISGHKFNDENGNAVWDNNESGIQNWTIDLEDTSDNVLATTTTAADGSYTFSNLTPGTYRVREVGQNGWTQTTTNPADITVSSGQDVENVDFGNQGHGTIVFTKYFDANKNGIKDDGEQVLPGWDMNVDGVGTQTTDASGTATFNVVAGIYSVNETQQADWTQTGFVCSHTVNFDIEEEVVNLGNGAFVQVDPGETVTCEVGNYTKPVLTITKTNDKLGTDQNPGSAVTYTLTITATQSAAQNVVLTDLLPKGFAYRDGSATIDRGDGSGVLAFTDFSDDYHSPGIWNIGTINKDQTITVTLIADISGDQNPGNYKDVAYAQGQSLAGETVAANSEPTSNSFDNGVVDDNFVGTQVAVVKDQQDNPTINVINKQDVLGASTSLPDTGANTLWVVLGGLVTLTGLVTISFGIILKKR